MGRINIDFNKITGKMKIMHAANNGPARKNNDHFENFSKLKIPYVRNHDASLSEPYGCQHVVDIHCIFPDFSKNEYDEKNYDFKLTDEYTKTILDTGSKVFYRLGSSIEHWEKKYGTVMPSDFSKWARICEHIIMHYNEGWADGFNYNIEYWEIWNEADLNADDAEDKLTWGGTKKDYFEFYDTVSKHLKSRFPNLKIGGPASCGNTKWMEEFIAQLNAPLDFFSFHMYAYKPQFMAEYATTVKNILIKYGYGDVETILDEWNYVRDWNDRLEYIKTIHGMKGAAYIAATMCAIQNCGMTDMMMYYDARQVTAWNGLFDFYTKEPLKGYYSMLMFSKLYDLKNQTVCVSDDRDIIATSAADNGKYAAMITYYSLDEGPEKDVKINTGIEEALSYFILDENNDMTQAGKINNGDTIKMKPNSVIFIEN